ncbi:MULTISPECIES: GNAT family N-acetyltransferase [Thermococcus]|uniref:GNAT family N-acetyltransferase n=1 Tax=Thermococcus aciditolerans TaxID=2598455 RepID=A0A5C0SJB7_9EURY|nr:MULTISPECIES: GNAT family N-acetyltransferase [Thermococcus]QEK13797.1 GNAT family N-acetyltransferase [Thermococcus aciditolerans]
MEPLIRDAKPEDRPSIEEIARLTWGGEDYLARVFDEWLRDGHFYVLEVDGKVIGTAKLTLLPGKVGWLEGLRVHPDYRGRGYGRKLHGFMLELGERLAREGKIEALEFATYFLNRESIAMAKRDGFKVVARFYYIQRPPVPEDTPERAEIKPSDEMEYRYIPYGWKFLHNCRQSREWLKEKAEIREYRGFKFLYPPMSENDPTFSPFKLSIEAIGSLLPATSFEAKRIGYDSIDIMLPEERKDLIEPLKELGFKNWADFREPDVLVFRKKLI